MNVDIYQKKSDSMYLFVARKLESAIVGGLQLPLRCVNDSLLFSVLITQISCCTHVFLSVDGANTLLIFQFASSKIRYPMIKN